MALSTGPRRTGMSPVCNSVSKFWVSKTEDEVVKEV